MIDYILGFVSLYFLTYIFLTYIEEEWDEPETSEFPKITILIPAFNESKGIESTVKSALGQDYPDFEVIVIDDGSTDDTADKANRFGVKVIRQKNSGKATAMNKGISLANGELIATLDADSVAEKDALRNMVGFFKEPEVMAVTATMKVKDEKNTLVRMQKAEYIFSNMMVKIFSLLESVVVTPGPLSLFRKKTFDELGGFKGKTMAEDNEMALRIQGANYKIRSSKKAVVYTKAPDSLGALFRQRKRWYVGYVENIRSYLWLINPKYGELGAFIIPASILLIVLNLAKMSTGLASSLLDFPGQGTSEIVTQPYEVLMMVSLGLSMVLFFISLVESKENPTISIILHMILMILLSPIIYAYSFLMKGFEIVTGRSAKW